MRPLLTTLLRAGNILLRIVLFLLFLPLNCLLFVPGVIFMMWVDRDRSLWGKYLRLATKLGLKRVAGFPPRLLLAWEQKDEWRQVLPHLPKLKSDKERAKVAGSFATLYLWDERLAEARDASNYWMQVSDDWVQEHPEEARTAARIYQRSMMWYPYGFPSLYPADVLESQKSPSSLMMSETKVLAKAIKLDQGIVMEWRDARLVGALVDWVTGKQLTEGVIWEYSPDQIKPSLSPSGYDSVHFARFFVAYTGIPESEFKRMWRKASSLDDLGTDT